MVKTTIKPIKLKREEFWGKKKHESIEADEVSCVSLLEEDNHFTVDFDGVEYEISPFLGRYIKNILVSILHLVASSNNQ